MGGEWGVSVVDGDEGTAMRGCLYKGLRKVECPNHCERKAEL